MNFYHLNHSKLPPWPSQQLRAEQLHLSKADAETRALCHLRTKWRLWRARPTACLRLLFQWDSLLSCSPHWGRKLFSDWKLQAENTGARVAFLWFLYRMRFYTRNRQPRGPGTIALGPRLKWKTEPRGLLKRKQESKEISCVVSPWRPMSFCGQSQRKKWKPCREMWESQVNGQTKLEYKEPWSSLCSRYFPWKTFFNIGVKCRSWKPLKNKTNL